MSPTVSTGRKACKEYERYLELKSNENQGCFKLLINMSVFIFLIMRIKHSRKVQRTITKHPCIPEQMLALQIFPFPLRRHSWSPRHALPPPALPWHYHYHAFGVFLNPGCFSKFKGLPRDRSVGDWVGISDVLGGANDNSLHFSKWKDRR